MSSLAVNVDHVATIRQARGGIEPDPVAAAHLAEIGGAEAIIVHLREDRRHIQDRDLTILRRTVKTRLSLEMAATEEMQQIALKELPEMVCLVPEKREELTTEGGLDVASRVENIKEYLKPLHAAGIESSLFIDADPAQIEASKATGAKFIELHTGHYADYKGAEQEAELARILDGIKTAQEMGLIVNLGHGLNYVNIKPFAEVPGVNEYSIGHAIISRAVYTGLEGAVRDMAAIIAGFVE
jgi:pyridoxine 5-phosphate synthase